MKPTSKLAVLRLALRIPQVKIGAILTGVGLLGLAWLGGALAMSPFLFFGGWFLGMGMLLDQQLRDAKEAALDVPNVLADRPHALTCPICASAMEPGNLSVNEHKNGLDLFGWSLSHCWFVPEEGPKELLVSNELGLRATHPNCGSFREAHPCPQCHTAIAPGEGAAAQAGPS